MSSVRRLFSLAALLALAGCGSDSSSPNTLNLPNSFSRTNLVSGVAGFSDAAGTAAVTDPNLKNPWESL